MVALRYNWTESTRSLPESSNAATVYSGVLGRNPPFLPFFLLEDEDLFFPAEFMALPSLT